MSVDAYVDINAGEAVPIQVTFTAQAGTNTISGNPTYSLYDSTGAIVSGHNAQAVTGFNNTAMTAPEAWKTLDTVSPTVLTGGWYTLVFTVSLTNSVDGIARTRVRKVRIWVEAVP